jgi:hypothetical protein
LLATKEINEKVSYVAKKLKPHHVLKDYLNTTGTYNNNATLTSFAEGHAFMAGLESSSFAQNATACYDSWIHFYEVELRNLEIALHYAAVDDVVFNITYLIGEVADHLQLCTSFSQGLFYFYYN